MAIGWISIHRKIQECTIWIDDEPFDRRSAWIDLLLLANHEDKKMIFDGKVITVQRGQRITSVRHLAERWRWSPKKTLSYLRLLESEQMIIKESDSRKTLLTIVNYDIYQGMGNAEETPRKHLGNSEETVGKQSLPTNNNDNNDNNDNKVRRFAPPTLEEVKSYCQERNNNVDPVKFFDYYQQGQWKDSKGNPVKNWKQKLITWENKQPKAEPKKWKGVENKIDFEELKRRCVVN